VTSINSMLAVLLVVGLILGGVGAGEVGTPDFLQVLLGSEWRFSRTFGDL